MCVSVIVGRMVDVIGHLGMALIWLAPTWIAVDRPKTAATAIATGFWFGMFPDVDLVVSNYLASVQHHGVFHTILAVLIFAAVVGPIVGWIWKSWLGDSEWFSPEATDRAYQFGFVIVFVAALSHLFADMLSAPDIAPPIEPLWPLVNGQIVTVDLVWYTSPLATWGFFLVGLAVNIGVGYWAINHANERNAATS